MGKETNSRSTVAFTPGTHRGSTSSNSTYNPRTSISGGSISKSPYEVALRRYENNSITIRVFLTVSLVATKFFTGNFFYF